MADTQRPDRRRTDAQRHRQRTPVRLGATVGAAAFAAVYAAMFALTSMMKNSQETFNAWGEIPVTGWFMASAHNVHISVTDESAFNIIQSNTDALAVPAVLYYLVPAVALAYAGRYVAQNTPANVTDATDAAMNGATVAAGYGGASVLAAATVFSKTRVQTIEYAVSTDVQSVTLAPKLGETVLFMAIAYPVVLGALGAYVWYERQPHHAK